MVYNPHVAQARTGSGPAGSGGAGKSSKTGQAGKTRMSGMSGAPKFTWHAIPGRAPASSIVDWTTRRFSSDLDVNRAKRQNATGMSLAREDYRLAAKDRSKKLVEDRTDAGLSAAGAGVGYNPALLGRKLDGISSGFESDMSLMRQEREKRTAALRELLDTALERRRVENVQQRGEIATSADPRTMMRGL